VDPAITGLEALLASLDVLGEVEVLDLIEVRASGHAPILADPGE
jgi:hypothetical protein